MQALESERLILRGWTDDDADFVLDLYSRWEVQRFIGRVPRVMSERKEALAATQRWRASEHPIHGIWAVQRRDTGQLAGVLLLKSIPASSDQPTLQPSGDTEIGWHFHPDHWGHGYAAEAGLRVLQHAFEAGLSEVVAVTHPENIASQGVATRIGMTHAGRTSRYYNTECELFTVSRRT
jgi:RimJ/RimL family protein N-acetyltransferase